MNADNSRQNNIAMRALCECIDGYGNSGAYVSPDLHRRIVAQWKKLDEACPDMQPIFLAESCAFGTTGFPLGGPRCQRGSYFGTCDPGWAGRDPVEFPVGSDVSDDVIAYWQARVEAAGFPRIKAHYSDLVWEYSEGRKIKDSHKYANRAANEYLNAYAEDPQMRYRCADRAIHLALIVNDQNAVERAVNLSFDRLQQPPATPEPARAAFNLLIGRKGITLSSGQEAFIIQRLDDSLCASRPEDANPELCTGAVMACLPVADCLIAYFSKKDDKKNILDVLQKLVQHHLADFAGAGPLRAPQLLSQLR